MVMLPLAALERNPGSAPGLVGACTSVSSPGSTCSTDGGRRGWGCRDAAWSPVSENSESPQSGAAFYDLCQTEVLGSGGSSTVRMARHKHGGSPCAVKILRKKGAQSRCAWLHEAAIMQDLEHPGICQLLDITEDSSNMYLVLEYVEGHDLFEEVSTGRCLGERCTAGILRQVLTALAHCHDHAGVVHRDIKPENVMLRTGGREEGAGAAGAAPRVKLIDFGTALYAGRWVKEPVGTLRYMAPESFANGGTCNAALDLWSTGMVLYSCLFGELPCSAVCRGELPVLQAASRKGAASEAALDLVSRLLHPAAEERPSAAQALAHAWLRTDDLVPPVAPALAAGCTLACLARTFRRIEGLDRVTDPLWCSQCVAGGGCVGRAEILGLAAKQAPAEDSGSFLSCMGSLLDQLDSCCSCPTATAEWLDWLEERLEEANAEAMAEPAEVFRVFDLCPRGVIPTGDADEAAEAEAAN